MATDATTMELDLTDVPPEMDAGPDAEGFANGDIGDPETDPGIHGMEPGYLTPFDTADGDDPNGGVDPEGIAAGDDPPTAPATGTAFADSGPPLSPAAVLVSQLHRRILRAKKALRLRHAEYLEAKESAKAAKERFSAAQTDLNALIGELCKALTGEGQLPLPLAADEDPGEDFDEDFDPDDSDDADERDQQPRGDAAASVATPATPTTAPTAKPDPAKLAPLSALAKFGLTESKAEKLAEANIRTIADLEACIQAGRLQQIRGIGDVAVDKITDAVLAWREQNPAPDEPA